MSVAVVKRRGTTMSCLRERPAGIVSGCPSENGHTARIRRLLVTLGPSPRRAALAMRYRKTRWRARTRPAWPSTTERDIFRTIPNSGEAGGLARMGIRLHNSARTQWWNRWNVFATSPDTDAFLRELPHLQHFFITERAFGVKYRQYRSAMDVMLQKSRVSRNAPLL
jgi:hypothetical protein